MHLTTESGNGATGCYRNPRGRTHWNVSGGFKLVFCSHLIRYNLMIENDRGGVHAAIELRRVAWVVAQQLAVHRQAP